MPARRSGVMARRRGNPNSSLVLLGARLHGVYPERKNEILRFAQNDKSEGFAMTICEMLTYLGRSL